MKKILVILCICLVSTFSVQAQEKKVTGIEKGESAPFGGVLFSPGAAAELLAEKERLIAEHLLELSKQQKLEEAKRKLMEDTLRAELTSDKLWHQAIIEEQDNEIKRLQEIYEEDSNDHIWWLVGGVGAGVLIAGSVALGVWAAQ